MNGRKEITILICAFLTALSIVACGKTKEVEFDTNQQAHNIQTSVSTDSETTTEELLDSFINGSISAVDSTNLTSTFYITDLNLDSEEWNSYSIGEKIDLDNDGENELIINGPYGKI